MLCPQCKSPVEKGECDCGWVKPTASGAQAAMPEEDRKAQWLYHNRCWYETNNRRCYMIGTLSNGIVETSRKDLWGKNMRGPLYCTWHFDKLSVAVLRKASEIQEYDYFCSFVTKSQNHSQSQWSFRTPELLWKAVNGLGAV